MILTESIIDAETLLQTPEINQQYEILGKWEVQLIAKEKPHPAAIHANPNLEHAYVYFMENELGVSLV